MVYTHEEVQRGRLWRHGGLVAPKEPNEAAGSKRLVVEVPVEGYMDKSAPFPTKKVKGGQKVGNEKGKQSKAVKEESGEDED
ncbi:hypothetical protein H4I96_11998 [Botrytis cinerea]